MSSKTDGELVAYQHLLLAKIASLLDEGNIDLDGLFAKEQQTSTGLEAVEKELIDARERLAELGVEAPSPGQESSLRIVSSQPAEAKRKYNRMNVPQPDTYK